MACRYINEPPGELGEGGIDYDDLLGRRTESGQKAMLFPCRFSQLNRRDGSFFFSLFLFLFLFLFQTGQSRSLDF